MTVPIVIQVQCNLRVCRKERGIGNGELVYKDIQLYSSLNDECDGRAMVVHRIVIV